jgi:phosphate:Na+ symporter
VSKLAFLDLLGGLALLLWGLHMVQSGIVPAFCTELRRFLGRALKNRFAVFLVGVGITAILQSSIATTLMASSFSANGMLELVAALSLMLGANVRATDVVQVMSFDVTAETPVRPIVGVLGFVTIEP